ncbi:YdcF family protein [Cytophagaceae bacterium ABcell3]|nr:YdcF family protein [Cytophagaceae bacterium ABcell3]
MNEIRTVIDDLNDVARFLARRDIPELSKEAFIENFQIPTVDVVLVLGCSIPYVAQLGAAALSRGIGKKLMISGGLGHSTKYLVDKVKELSIVGDEGIELLPEAEIFKKIITQVNGIDENDVLVENLSTNCGSNACESLKLLRGINQVPRSVLLLQDPTMQLRTHASFLKEWAEEDCLFISYAPFVPSVIKSENTHEFLNNDVLGLWSFERFVDLVLGEIPRLRNDENGYGPNGKGFIAPVEVPENVLLAHERLVASYQSLFRERS